MSSEDDRLVKSYTYLRTAMVALLVGLAVAVFWQTARQHWHLLGSVSAYYYTAAQTIFVGALIGLGACMIALKGTRRSEEILLNLGGVFAAVVAVVPTARSEDYRRALVVCRQADVAVLNEQTANPDCDAVWPLADAARASVENGIAALLVVGALALVATLFFAARDGSTDKPFWWGFGAAVLLWVAGLIAMLTSLTALIDNAHYLAALGLFACILGVVLVNARRFRDEPPTQGKRPSSASAALQNVTANAKRHRYNVIALAMLVVTPVLAVLWLTDQMSLFWLEIFVAAIFIVFWMVQTVEMLPPRGAATIRAQQPDRAVVGK
ncbi:hypothetical protein DFJ67_5463 [Asanoa ferruginea]|uniref:Uncharacterized protein n=1 Tax=Asanoa ferruginea TaxID=53367 RepID=A0A3D9ZQH9_9ACTN|nr:hypothetical protein [Asanoa ferruginea]REF99427.1 hypothetical protein DFJ67_5463 [Asanoa ferruginea]GIF46032.1 hypothetical protein Afe04nite_05710 [Asanoa ferruginea]